MEDRNDSLGKARGEYRRGLIGMRKDVGVGPGYLYRRGELLVAAEDADLIDKDLRRLGAVEPDRGVEGMVRYSGIEADIPKVLGRLRRPRRGRTPEVSMNHVLPGQPELHGGPATFALPTEEPAIAVGDGGVGSGVTVAVLDTGIALSDGKVSHPFLAGNCAAADPTVDAEEIDSNPVDHHLDDESGHGTFIAGIVLRHAPGSRVVAAQVLESDGIGDDWRVARRLIEVMATFKPKVVNLSLGGYTENNLPPPCLSRVIEALPDHVVVVAAAGNDGISRPFWPAAMKGVVAVGALECEEGPAPQAGPARCRVRRATYSNYGWWVDACAMGDWVSTFVSFSDPAHPSTPLVPLTGGVSLPPRDFKDWARWQGTSFAAPCVAGAIAAMITTKGLSAREAAYLLTRAPGLKRLPGLGAVVDFLA